MKLILPRKNLLRVLAALVTFAAFNTELLKTACAQGTSATDRTIKARDFMDTFGVNLHFEVNNYRNTQAIADALNTIGFSRVRIKCTDAQHVADWKDLTAKSSAYFPAGLKADVIIVGYLNAPDVTLEGQKKIIPEIADTMETIEGPNEMNNYSTGHGTHGPFDTTDETMNFAQNSAAWAKALYDWRKSDPKLSKVLLLAPSLASGRQAVYASLPDISAYVDSGNFHFYAGHGYQPSNFGGGNFTAIYKWYRAAATPTKPVSMTEWGQTTADCDEATQAKYILNQLFDAASLGVYRAYLYQLMDGTADGDPAGHNGEAHFGIFDYQWHPKPAALALENVNHLLSDRGTDFTPNVSAYQVSGVTNAGKAGSSLSISKSDGSTLIVVWNEPQIWDAKAKMPVTPPADPVTVRFGGTYTYRVYDPLAGAKPIATGTASSVAVNLVGSPLMIQVLAK